MSKMHDEKLEVMLKSRHIEAASPGLAQRIILKAQGIPQKRMISLWEFLQQLFAEFHLAKPAYVLAGTLLLGFIIGFSEPLGTTTANDVDGAQVQSFLYADESIL